MITSETNVWLTFNLRAESIWQNVVLWLFQDSDNIPSPIMDTLNDTWKNIKKLL